VSSTARVLAVDLGATSVRVAAVDLDADVAAVQLVHRWRNAPVGAPDGSLRWDWPRIHAEISRGIEMAIDQGPVASIGVDGWGVDYGLIDEDGALVEPPYSYRDSRTAGWQDIADAIGRDRLYEASGIQLQPFNTLFQLAVHDRKQLDRAAKLLLLPDLVVHHLTGTVGAERSNASTTGLLDAQTGEWSDYLLDAIEVRPSILPTLRSAGTLAGTWHDVPVHLVGSHDTASAFLGMPGGGAGGTAFVSAGTWVIIGIEQLEADTSPGALARNFSNETGAFGGFRFLKNVMGFWLIEQCRPGWGNPAMNALMSEAARISDPVPTFDAADERFLHPPDMEAEVRAAAGLAAEATRSVVVRSILESVAAGIAAVVGEIQDVTGSPIHELALVGGGAQASLLRDLIVSHVGLPVVIGSSEATALGNAIAQGVALGHFSDLDAARRWVGTAEPRPPVD